MFDDVVFWALALPAVAAGVMVFRFDSMARATYALLTSLLCVGGEVLLLGLDYLGVVIVLMMTIEMAVMAVFMVMYMMNPAGLMPMTMVHNAKGAVVICAAVLAVLVAGILLAPWPARRGEPSADPTRDLGLSLMGPQMLTMMTLGLALVATIVATVVLATRRGRYDRYGDDVDARCADDPVRGGTGR
ncbi:NADH-quinone oxidoreductase subunit J [Streptomyces neyagawaensis]|uniref:NADH-quinone oxidoreductase subunit J n=1 Tax=Streptomyces neyagawaensis TaxID=42238 RepID=UPI0006E4675D|nr:NADH-quinone oxidoreductase subunit J [Streptomyces neyagawaensis]MCL6734834.1 NADH-quinone oxidoreductase subunit J [Streptomyces neyagawaensis]MDE1686500.1 NADH-quinone oxidoreductase subunit J [Streptomyces neyagawaensis]